MHTKTNSFDNGNRPSSPLTDNSGKHTILYIEDNAVNRELVRSILDLRPDFLCIEAETGKQGLESARHHRPNLILLDIKLPDMDGFTVAQHLQSYPETATIPIVALSGGDLIQEKGAACFKGFIQKPFDIMKFYTAIDSILQL